MRSTSCSVKNGPGNIRRYNGRDRILLKEYHCSIALFNILFLVGTLESVLKFYLFAYLCIYFGTANQGPLPPS